METLDELSARVDRLERGIRNWKMMNAGIALALMAWIGFVATSARPGNIVLARSTSVAQRKGGGAVAPAEIVAQRFVLVDKHGRVLATLEDRNRGLSAEPTDKQNWAVLSLFDQNGEESKTAASLTPNILTLGDNGAIFQVTAAGKTVLLELAGDEQTSLALLSNKGSLLSLKSDRGYFAVREEPDSTSFNLRYFQNEDWRRTGASVSVHLDPDSGSFSVFNRTGSVDLDAKARGASLSLGDSNKAARAVLGSTQLRDARTDSTITTAPSSLTLFNEKGHVLWQAP